MKPFYLQIILWLAVCVACSRPSRLEQALTFAGANRAELEAVLAHYSKEAADSLKYRAACFLIENMPFHYSCSSGAIDRYMDEVSRYAAAHEYPVNDYNRNFTIDTFDDVFPSLAYSGYDVVMDSHVITADFLINNIERAFEAWRRQPWGKDIPFDDFCEQILPYRVADEPLQDWRQLYGDFFRPRVDSLCAGASDPVAAGKALYDFIYNNQRWIFCHSVTSRYTGAATLFHNRLGDCRLMAHYAVYAFRALGIPCGMDMILQNPDMLYKQHYWNYMKDRSGQTVRFELHQTAPERGNRMNRKTGKIYRSFFGMQPGSPPGRCGTELPALLNDRLMADVSGEYYGGATLEIETDGGRRKSAVLFLGVFNNTEWIPIACSAIKNGKAVFEHLEPDIVYQPLYYSADGGVEEAGFPVAVREDGRCRVLTPGGKGGIQDSKFKVPNSKFEIRDSTFDCSIKRKYPLPDWIRLHAHRSVGGRFEAAADSLFTRPVVIYTHTDSLTFDWYDVKIDCPEKFRYVRYCSARDAHISIAEIRFISDGQALKGKAIGFDSPSMFGVPCTKEVAFDGDPLTFCESDLPDGEWVGLELEKPARITEIEYIFRNDDNNIREGDVYELFYFTDRGKVSLGKRTGVKNGTLTYENVPANALYLLHDETRGREERPFTFDDEGGGQVWY
jgi:hypothetical protein